jgi:hypothetical protein
MITKAVRVTTRACESRASTDFSKCRSSLPSWFVNKLEWRGIVDDILAAAASALHHNSA